MTHAWFVLKDESMDGPLTTEEVQSRLKSGLVSSSWLIWGRGMPEWRALSWWVKELPNLEAKSVGEETVIVSEEVWHYALGGKSHGPLKRSVLLNELRRAEPLGDVLLWTKGMKEWTPIYEFHDVLSELGVNKREFPRADLHGRAVIKTGASTLMAPLLTISEGGLGIQLDGGLVPGMVVDIEIHSPAFRDTLTARAETRYVSTGVVGLRFKSLNAETKGTILAFVRQNQTKFVLKAA
jgi:hypothetical protein